MTVPIMDISEPAVRNRIDSAWSTWLYARSSMEALNAMDRGDLHQTTLKTLENTMSQTVRIILQAADLPDNAASRTEVRGALRRHAEDLDAGSCCPEKLIQELERMAAECGQMPEPDAPPIESRPDPPTPKPVIREQPPDPADLDRLEQIPPERGPGGTALWDLTVTMTGSLRIRAGGREEIQRKLGAMGRRKLVDTATWGPLKITSARRVAANPSSQIATHD